LWPTYEASLLMDNTLLFARGCGIFKICVDLFETSRHCSPWSEGSSLVSTYPESRPHHRKRLQAEADVSQDDLHSMPSKKFKPPENITLHPGFHHQHSETPSRRCGSLVEPCEDLIGEINLMVALALHCRRPSTRSTVTPERSLAVR
jgi:hypothetical protein